MGHKILVTGGAGYIGSMVCKILAKNGYTPITFDNLSRGHKDFVKWGPLHIGDLTHVEDLEEAFKKFAPDSVIHLGALAYVVESVEKPHTYYLNNVLGTLHLLGVMRKYGVSHLVFSSSCATYGIPKQIPIIESHKKEPINPYGKTKWMAEQMIKDFEMAYGFKTAILRYFNAAGTDPDLEVGEIHDPETHLIPLTILAALKKRGLTIYGEDFPTQDKTAVRDYVHVQDLADAHLLALNYITKGDTSLAVNLGTGQGYSVKQIIEQCEKIAKCQIPYQTAPKREGEPAILIADSRAAYDTLGWKARYSDLNTIIETAYSWHKKRAH